MATMPASLTQVSPTTITRNGLFSAFDFASGFTNFSLTDSFLGRKEFNCAIAAKCLRFHAGFHRKCPPLSAILTSSKQLRRAQRDE
jgi:hypothetical protein